MKITPMSPSKHCPGNITRSDTCKVYLWGKSPRNVIYSHIGRVSKQCFLSDSFAPSRLCGSSRSEHQLNPIHRRASLRFSSLSLKLPPNYRSSSHYFTLSLSSSTLSYKSFTYQAHPQRPRTLLHRCPIVFLSRRSTAICP